MRKFLSFLLSASWLFASPVRAAEAPLPVLTFEEALTSVRESNPDLKATRARLLAARQSVLMAWSSYLPHVEVGGSYTRNSTAAVLPFPNFQAGFDIATMPSGDVTAIPKEFSNVEVQRRDQYGAQLSVSQPLLYGAAIPSIRGAYTAEAIASLTAEETERQMLFATAELYLNAVGLREAHRLSADQVVLLEGHLHNAEVAFAAGTVMQLAVLRAKMDLGQAQQDYIQATNAYAAVRSSLAALIGRDDVHFDVAGADLHQLGEPNPVSADHKEHSQQDDKGSGVPSNEQRSEETGEPLTKALSERADVRAATLGIEARKRAKQAVWAQLLPVISANWTLRYSDVKGFTGNNTVWALMLTASLPLFNGGLRYAQLQEAEAKIVEANAQAEALRAKIADEVRRAELDVASAAANRQKAFEQAELARKNWTAVEAAFEVGASSPTDAADASAALKGAELALVRETIQVWVADLHLKQALGAPEPDSIPAGLQYSPVLVSD